jgi:hypothetical protein
MIQSGVLIPWALFPQMFLFSGFHTLDFYDQPPVSVSGQSRRHLLHGKDPSQLGRVIFSCQKSWCPTRKKKESTLFLPSVVLLLSQKVNRD